MKYLKKSFQGMVPYHSKMISDGIILNANESPFNLPYKIKNEFMKKINSIDFNRYPDTDDTILVQAISKFYNVKEDEISCGVGSDSLIDCIFKACIEEDDIILTVKPTFSMYSQYASIYKAKMEYVDLDENFNYDSNKIIERSKIVKPKIIILCTPNNPTGTTLSLNEVENIVKSTDALVVVDEAYFEFEYKNKDSAINLINKYDNVIVLRTFSKLYAFASGRIGYAISCKDNIDTINTIKSPYFVNTMTMIIASLILENSDSYKDRINYIRKEKERMYKELKNLNILVYPSKCNFLWMKLDDEIVNALDDNKIYIRKMKYNDEKYYRLTIGLKDENNKVLNIIKNTKY